MPELLCRTCSARDGVEHHCDRVTTLFEKDGKPLPEPLDSCAHCNGDAGTKISVPADQKLWLMQQVNPQEYEPGREGGPPKLKDWAQAELEARIAKPDQDDVSMAERAKEKQRERARAFRAMGKTSLTPTEVERITERINDARRRQELLEMGFVLPE